MSPSKRSLHRNIDSQRVRIQQLLRVIRHKNKSLRALMREADALRKELAQRNNQLRELGRVIGVAEKNLP